MIKFPFSFFTPWVAKSPKSHTQKNGCPHLINNMNDPVNKPQHYSQGPIEAIDALESSMSAEAFEGYLKGNVMKYMWRYELKNRLQDLLKAQWYLQRLIAKVDELKLSTLEEIIAEEEILDQIEKNRSKPF
tara:strand:+ start:122 stop:514 length:393 start_codon:yes stop_codon:yes gene_type:complete